MVSKMMDNVVSLKYEDKEITLIGTAHVLQESVELVEQTINTICPDTVCIELDVSRYKSIQNPEAWKNTNVADIIKSKKVGLLLANLILSSYQKRVAQRLDTVPGKEMLQGIKSANDHQCNLVLADRDIQITFLRVWRKLTLYEKCKLFSSLFLEEDSADDEQININDLIEKDNLDAALSSIAKSFPKIAEILIHERDQYLAYKIKTAPGKKIVAVVGAAHILGIKKEIYRQQNLDSITSIPKSSGIVKVFACIIPMVMLLLIGYSFITNLQMGLQQLSSWILWNGVLAALFTALALGHPLTILAAFVSAPITSVDPLLACGWITGIVEATIRKPTVKDVNNVPEDIFHITRFFKNRFLKALAIVFFSNIGSAIGTLIAGTDIIKNII